MVTDRVGDFIIRLQNAAAIGKREVEARYSEHVLAIAKKLVQLGFLTAASVSDKGAKAILAELAYDDRGHAKLRGVRRISKPGRRLYVTHQEAHTVKGGTGSRIISSPLGIVSDKEARKEKVGGEELFEIW